MKALVQFFRHKAFLMGAILLAALQAYADPVWANPSWNGRIDEAVFSADATRVACRLADGSVTLKDLSVPETVWTHTSAHYAVTSIALSGDGSTLAWGDSSGMLQLWSADRGHTYMQLSDAGLTTVRLNADGSTVCAAGDGVRTWIKRTSNFGYIGNPLLNSQQIMALASDDSGNAYIAVDHSGRLATFSSDSSAVRIGELYMVTPAGIEHVGRDPVEWVLWDVSGNVTLLSENIGVIEIIDTNGLQITAALTDAAGNRLLFADAKGSLHQITLSDYSLSTLSGSTEDSPIAGLGGTEETGFVAMSETGELLASASGENWSVTQPAMRGHLLRAHVSLQAGLASVVTDQEATAFRLVDGSGQPVSSESPDIILDSAIFHANGESAPLRLLMDREDLSLRVEGNSLPNPIIIEEDWTPVRLAASPWAPHLALMSSDGEIRIYEAQPQGLVEISRLDPTPGTLWEDLEFTEDGQSVIRLEAVNAMTARAPDGPFQIQLDSGGELVLERVETDSAFLAWPDLRPAEGGGMDSGYLGNIRAIRDAWFLQREFGWGYFTTTPHMNFFQFPGEGWLAGNASLGSYLYSYSRDSWVYTLVSDFPSDWVYDFAQGSWRRFP